MKIFLRIVLGLLGFLVLLYLAVIFIGTPVMKSAIEKRLVYYPEDSLSIGLLELQLFPLGLEANNISFRLHQPGDSLIQRYSGDLEEIEVVGINWWRVVRHNTWEVERTEIDEGSLHWTVTSIEAPDTTRQKPKPAGKKANLLIENLDISQLNLELNRDSLRVNLQVSVMADSLKFNRGDSLRWGYSQVAMHSEDASYSQPGGDYDLAYHSLDFDSRNKNLSIKNLRVKPRLDSAEWDQKYPHRKALIQQLEVPQIVLSGFELSLLPHGFFARQLSIDSANLILYNNMSHELPQKKRSLPSELIADINLPLSIDTLSITHASLLYRFVPKRKETNLARLEGDQIQLKAYPLSNIGHDTAADLHIDFSMRMMQEANLQLNAFFPGGSPDHEFKLDVSLSPTSFMAFNPLVYPNLGIKIKEGYCEQLVASMRGNDYRCDGQLDMAYHDLEVEFPENNKEGLNLLSEAKEIGVNLILLNSNNDMGSNTGNIAHKRLPNRPFIGYWWHSLQSGLVPVLVRFKDNE